MMIKQREEIMRLNPEAHDLDSYVRACECLVRGVSVTRSTSNERTGGYLIRTYNHLFAHLGLWRTVPHVRRDP